MRDDGEVRARVPAVADLRPVVQPPSVTGRRVEHWTAGLYLRRVSPYLTRVLLRAGLSANTVTGLMIVTGVLAGLALLVSGPAGVVLAVVLAQLQMLWDCCDGEVARWRRQQSAVGVFLDTLGHHLAEVAIAVGLGVRVARSAADWPDASTAVLLGVVLALGVVLNRSVNVMAQAARAAAGLPVVAEAAGGDRTRPHGTLGRLRDLARWFPVHRLLHSVELTLLVAAAALLDPLLDGRATPGLLVGLAVVVPVVLAGHVAAVVSSRRLRT